MNINNCLICKGEIVYLEDSESMNCYYCNKIEESKARCENGHYVCDSCHRAPSNEIIKNYCMNSLSKNPMSIFMDIIKHSSIHMHGPEHHFLVPAVLTTAYYNALGDRDNLKKDLIEIEKRAQNVIGGFCGFYGNCGAAVGTGIYISVILRANPLSKEEWKLCNLMTSRSLSEIALSGGPRCCKRDSFIAIREAVKFTNDFLKINIEHFDNVICGYSHLNNQCLMKECEFHRS